MKFPPPAHDIAPEPVADQAIVDTLLSRSGDRRLIITVDAADLYRVYEEHWNTTWIGDGGSAFWSRNGPMHFTDSIEDARRVASEHLAD
ncbi:MAG: hypothetical protein L0Z50_09420 [Verrucomicrobiales bacterium]|nr:hypothetical protein [Verrucomicrobiales bacterium]